MMLLGWVCYGRRWILGRGDDVAEEEADAEIEVEITNIKFK